MIMKILLHEELVVLTSFMFTLAQLGEIQCQSMSIAEFNKIMTGDHYNQVSPSTIFDCSDTCEDSTACQGFNFIPSTTACQMFNYSHYFPASVFEDHVEAIYMSNVLHPCSSTPYKCLNGGSCFENAGSSTAWRCVCLPGFIKHDCSDPVGSSTNPAKSCQEILQLRGPSVSSGAYSIQMAQSVVDVYCHMETIEGCGSGAWTMVMKINGNKNTFSYGSKLWSNKETIYPQQGLTGFDGSQTKVASYWNTPYNKLCLGMKYNAEVKWIVAEHTSTSLFDDIAPGTRTSLPISRSQWLSLLPGSVIQSGRTCSSGFNVCRDRHSKRIGITANNENNCLSQDSSFGFGGKSYHTCGSYCSYGCNSNTNADMCYILVQ